MTEIVRIKGHAYREGVRWMRLVTPGCECGERIALGATTSANARRIHRDHKAEVADRDR